MRIFGNAPMPSGLGDNAPLRIELAYPSKKSSIQRKLETRLSTISLEDSLDSCFRRNDGF